VYHREHYLRSQNPPVRSSRYHRNPLRSQIAFSSSCV
jgi:hypothetical protein